MLLWAYKPQARVQHWGCTTFLEQFPPENLVLLFPWVQVDWPGVSHLSVLLWQWIHPESDSKGIPATSKSSSGHQDFAGPLGGLEEGLVGQVLNIMQCGHDLRRMWECMQHVWVNVFCPRELFSFTRREIHHRGLYLSWPKFPDPLHFLWLQAPLSQVSVLSFSIFKKALYLQRIGACAFLTETRVCLCLWYLGLSQRLDSFQRFP